MPQPPLELFTPFARTSRQKQKKSLAARYGDESENVELTAIRFEDGNLVFNHDDLELGNCLHRCQTFPFVVFVRWLLWLKQRQPNVQALTHENSRILQMPSTSLRAASASSQSITYICERERGERGEREMCQHHLGSLKNLEKKCGAKNI